MRVIICVGIEWFSVECGFLHHPRRCNAVKDAALCRRWTRLCWCRTGDDCEALRLAAKTACKNNQHSSWCAQKTHTHRHISTLTTYSRQSSSLRPFIFHNEVRCIRCMTNTARTFAWRVESSATDAYFFFASFLCWMLLLALAGVFFRAYENAVVIALAVAAVCEEYTSCRCGRICVLRACGS